MGTATLATAQQAYTWSFPICPHRIRVDLAVIGALQHHVSTTTDPQQGLLIGRRRSGVTHIEGYRPLPAFDAQSLANAMEKTTRPVVGYYRIREGCAFILEPAEIDLCKLAFAEAGSVFLLVERRAEGPAEGTFAFWRSDAFVSNLPCPFPIDPAILAREPQPADPVGEEPAGEPGFLRRNTGTFGLLAAALLLVWILPALWVRSQSPAERGAVLPVPETIPVDGQSQTTDIAWDPQTLGDARSGLLRILDGRTQQHVRLTPEQLRLGTFRYTGGPGPIGVEMRVLGGDGLVAEVATSMHPATGSPTPAIHQADVQKLPAALSAPAPRRESRPGPPPIIVAAERKPAVKPFALGPANRRLPTSTPAIADAPPAVPIWSAEPALTASIPATAPPPAPAKASVPVEHLAPAAPERAGNKGSGRLIWTGTLQRRGVLELDQRSVSVGSLTGALPGVPVNVTVSPAEFGDGGLTVYTTDSKLDKHVEAPSARNGWNRIMYIWDPERVRQIAVLEQPNASNRFSHLALRSDARRCSMLVIDWAAR